MRTVFWNVDTQYDFMRADGALYVKDAELIEPNLARLTQLAQTYGVTVVNTADWHDENTKEISDEPDFIATFPKHCMQGTYGAQFILATKPESPYVIDGQMESIDEEKVKVSRNILLYKDAFNVVDGNPLAGNVLEILNPYQAVVYGVATNVCVDQTVMGILEQNVGVFVTLDAIKELPNLPLEETISRWQSNGAKMIGVDDVLRHI